MDFNLNHLRSFMVVARRGNLSAAAKELGMTQPNLGRQMTALAKEVGMELFVRHSRGLDLSQHGKEYFELCQRIVGELEHETIVIREKDSEPQGTLKIVTGIGTTDMIIEALELFSHKFPKLRYTFSSITDMFEFKIGDADVGVLPISIHDPDIVQHHLTDMIQRIYAAPRYLEKHSTPKTYAELKDHRLIGYTGENKETLNLQVVKDNAPDQYDQPFIGVNNGLNMRAALLHAYGIGAYYYDRRLMEKNLLVDVFPDMPDHRVPFYYTYHKRMQDSPKVQAFHEVAKEALRVMERS
ncbi:MAG: LysR family transcriptional regulator [Alphaproteobacteria bacterium]|jgi:DNA-binding transcriptional LysR family regulator|nr:LysR family transcriptional regulator [Alphaproteobacteria bacterium]